MKRFLPQNIGFLSRNRILSPNLLLSSRMSGASAAVEGKADIDVQVKSPSHGSYHWNLERALSVISLPLMGTALIYGSIPAVDIAMGIVLPIHIHLGFDAIITDYIPERRSKILFIMSTWLLRFFTALTLYGCYVINSRDVGLTALTAKLWTGGAKKNIKKD